MAFTKEEHENLLKEIAESGGDTPKMLELMQKLRDDFDEREGMLKKYGEERDKSEPEGEKQEEEKVREESSEDNREDGGLRRDPVKDWKAEYNDLKAKYVERFFGGDASKSEIKDERREEKAEEKKIDDLFKRKGEK